MGSSPSKKIVEGEVIETIQTVKTEELLWPTNPGNDRNHQYYWNLVSTNHFLFVELQKEGYIIATNVSVKPEHCHLWLRKKKTTKI